jgi:hypothetical protein
MSGMSGIDRRNEDSPAALDAAASRARATAKRNLWLAKTMSVAVMAPEEGLWREGCVRKERARLRP